MVFSILTHISQPTRFCSVVQKEDNGSETGFPFTNGRVLRSCMHNEGRIAA